MAKRRIEGSDIIAPDFTAQAIRDVLKLESALNGLKDNLKDVVTITRVINQNAGTSNTQGITNITTGYQQANAAQQQYAKIQQQISAAEAKLQLLLSGSSDRLIQLNKEIQQTTASIRAKQDVDNAQIGVYQKSVNELNKMSRALKDLYMAGKQNDAATVQMKKNYEALHLSVAKAEQEVGQFTRNVGNYGMKGQKAFNYELFQFQQIMRELPNFAISSRIGIMALSNNLPQAADAFKRISGTIDEATGKTLGFRGALMQVVKSVFSWQSALLVGITVAIAFADKIGELISGQKELGEYDKKRAEQLKQLNEEVERLNKSYIDEKVIIDQLVRVASDENESKANRKKAIDELNRISPEYLGNLTMENITTQEGITLLNTYISLLERRARAAGLMKKLESIEMRKYDLEQVDMYAKSFDRTAVRQIIGDEAADRIEDAVSWGGTLPATSKYYQKMYRDYVTAEVGRLYAQLATESAYIENTLSGLGVDALVKGGGSSAKTQSTKVGRSKISGTKDSKQFDRLAYELEQYEIYMDIIDREQKLAEMGAEIDSNVLKQKATTSEEMQRIEKDLQESLIRLKIQYNQRRIALLESEGYVGYDSVENIAKLRKEIELLQSQLGINEKLPKSATTEKDQQKQMKENAKALMQLAKTIDDLLVKDEQRRQAQLDRQIDATKRRQDDLKQMAALGSKQAKDNLAFEEKKQAELERKQQQMQRRQQQRQLAISALQAYSSKVNSGDQNAAASTMTDIATLLSFIGALSYYDGTEDTGKVSEPLDKNGGRVAILHNNERVMTAEQNKKVGGMTNDELAELAYTYRVVKNTPMSIGVNDDVVQKLESIETAIKNQKPPEMYWNDTDKAMEYKYQQGNKIVRQLHKTKGVWRS